ncbi:MAG: SUF system NifU family Fe-S cluster assembly protein [Proteobacteria bacterium]|nr:SUF system NifU family Fe-S cluster assembly protein [Pseudomonadota bacterium]
MSYREVFGEILADHHEAPRNWGKLERQTCSESGYNPLCGDKVTLSLRFTGEGEAKRLEAFAFEGEGCSICMASSSIMGEMVLGKKCSEIRSLIEAFREKMQGAEDVPGLPSGDSDQDIVALYGVMRFPVRIKCALLPWTTLKKGLETAA